MSAAPLTVRDIVRATDGALVVGDLGASVTGVSIDSRTLAVGDAFFAIRGPQLDGHAFAREAAGRGASCLVVHALGDDLPSHVPLVLVEDTTRALGRLGAFHRRRFAIPIAAVTGSNGKTTTKEMTAAVLARRWRVLKPASSFNNQWGLPLTLLQLRPEHGAAVLEIGANLPGEIPYLVLLAAPTVGVVTSVAASHTEAFGSLDGVAAEKSALVRAIDATGRVVLNADDPRVAAMASVAHAPVVTFGRAESSDVRAVGPVSTDGDHVTFTLEVGGERHPVRLSYAGVHNAQNALAAAAVGHVLGLSPAEIAAGLHEARPVKGRCVWRQAGAIRILDDTYNASPASLRAALETLVAGRREGRLVVMLGDMLELGDIAVEAHRDAGRAIAAAGVAEFVGMGRLAREAVDAAREAGLAESRHTTTLEDTVAHLLKRLAPGDALLVKGSRGMRMERVVDVLMARLAPE